MGYFPACEKEIEIVNHQVQCVRIFGVPTHVATRIPFAQVGIFWQLKRKNHHEKK
jgi:hypothetical protein